MVTNVTSFGKNGLYDWVVQRSTAIILGVYTLCLLSFLATHPGVGFDAWRGYILSLPMQIFSTIALLSIALHAWIGLWTISTDYLTSRQIGGSATGLRLAFQGAYMLVNVIYVLWGLRILWGA